MSLLNGPLDGAIPLFSPDGTTLYLAGAASPEPAGFRTDDPGLKLVPLFVDNDYRTAVLIAEISTDGSRVVVDSTTAVHVFRTADRTIETDYRTEDDLGSFLLPKPVHASATSVWAATTLAVDQRNPQLITATSGGEMRRWRLDERDWLSSACRMAGRDLTPDEWRRYVGTPLPENLRCGVSR